MAYSLALGNQWLDNRCVMCLQNHFDFVRQQELENQQTQEKSKQVTALLPIWLNNPSRLFFLICCAIDPETWNKIYKGIDTLLNLKL